MKTGKGRLPVEIATARAIVRRTTQADLAQIETWPAYPWPHEVFNMTNDLARSADGTYWWKRIEQPDRCHYSVVHSATDEIIGVHAFVRIDWEQLKAWWPLQSESETAQEKGMEMVGE